MISMTTQHVVLINLNLRRPTVSSALELWSQKILWSVGHSGNLRLADRLKNNNNTVAVLMVLMSLPGTPSILYGDEIGLKGLSDPDNDVSKQQIFTKHIV